MGAAASTRAPAPPPKVAAPAAPKRGSIFNTGNKREIAKSIFEEMTAKGSPTWSAYAETVSKHAKAAESEVGTAGRASMRRRSSIMSPAAMLVQEVAMMSETHTGVVTADEFAELHVLCGGNLSTTRFEAFVRTISNAPRPQVAAEVRVSRR